MNSDARKRLLLAGLLVVLAVLVYRAAGPMLEDRAAPPAAPPPAPDPPRGAATPGIGLEALTAPRGDSPMVRRNLFRFDAERPSGNGDPAVPEARPLAHAEEPALPPDHPPLDLELIGIVEAREQSARVAVLSDTRGVYHGYEGDIIEGRFRIVRVGDESVEIVRLADQTSHVIRLAGAAP
jgi:hypothetical protein